MNLKSRIRRSLAVIAIAAMMMLGLFVTPQEAGAYYGRLYANNCYVGWKCDASVNIPPRASATIMATYVSCDGYSCWESYNWLDFYCSNWFSSCDQIGTFPARGGYVNYVDITYGANRINWLNGHP